MASLTRIPERIHGAPQVLGEHVQIGRNLLEAHPVLEHILHDGRLGLGRELPGKLFGEVFLRVFAARADDLHEELLGIGHLQAVLPGGCQGQLRIVIGIVDGHPVDIPVDAEGLNPVDKPHLGRKGVLSAERNAVQRAQDGKVLGVERVLAGAEFSHDLAFGKEHCLLRLLNDQLGIGAQIRMRETPRKNRFISLR